MWHSESPNGKRRMPAFDGRASADVGWLLKHRASDKPSAVRLPSKAAAGGWQAAAEAGVCCRGGRHRRVAVVTADGRRLPPTGQGLCSFCYYCGGGS